MTAPYLCHFILKLDAAGQKYLYLVKTTWWTNYSHSLNSGQVLHTSVFLGDYTLLVKHNGNTIHQENLGVDITGKDIMIHVTGRRSILQISHVRKVVFSPCTLYQFS
jgi:hypothetical protein